MQDSFKPEGEITFKLTNSKGEVKETVVKNLVLSGGRQWITARMGGDTPPLMSSIAVGTGTTAAELTDTALEAQIDVATMTEPGGNVTANVIAYSATFPAGNATGSLTEAGILNEDDLMLSRSVFPVINKQVDDTLNVIWRVRIQ